MHTQTNEKFFKGYDIFCLPLSIFAKAIYFYLSKCKNKNNTAFPSHYDISIKVGCSVSKVKLALKELSESNLIHISNRFFESKKGKQSQTSNIYTIYSYPQIEIDNDTSIVSETSIDVKVEPIVENNITPPQPSCDYELEKTFNNNKDNKSIDLSNTTPKTDVNDNILHDIRLIFEQCDIKSYYLPSQNIIKSSVINMYCNDNFASKNKIPQSLIQERLRGLTKFIIDESLSNYAFAVESQMKIYSHNLYFEKILWNSIISSSLDEYIAEVS